MANNKKKSTIDWKTLIIQAIVDFIVGTTLLFIAKAIG